MASTLVVPPSKHTLFMRGFSTRQDIQKIREFFSRDAGGGCTVEFFKESDDRSKLFVALRFETKDTARDIMHKYDNSEVLGDRITISWFKDLRRARQKAAEERRQGRVSPLRNGFRPGQYRGGDHHRGGHRGGRGGQGGSWGRRQRTTSGGHLKGRRFDRSSSRSASRSRSRSYSGSRDGSRSGRDSSHSRSRSRTPEKEKRHTSERADDDHYDHSPDRQASDDHGADPGSSRWDASPDRPERPSRERRSHSRGSSVDQWSKEHSPKRSVSRDRERDHDRDWSDEKERSAREWNRRGERDWEDHEREGQWEEKERDWGPEGEQRGRQENKNRDWERNANNRNHSWDADMEHSPTRARHIRSAVAVPTRQEQTEYDGEKDQDYGQSPQPQRAARPSRDRDDRAQTRYYDREEEFSRRPRHDDSAEGWRDEGSRAPTQKQDRWNEQDSQYSTESARKRSLEHREEYARPTKDVDMRDLDNKRRKYAEDDADPYPPAYYSFTREV